MLNDLSQGFLPFGGSKPRRKAVNGENKPKAVCLFSSAGIGELGVHAAGIDLICSNEMVPYRAQLYQENFPKSQMLCGDIWKLQDEIISTATEGLGDDELFLLYATPPCQGMSTNGIGKLKFEVAEGRRDAEDPRNRLIIPTMDIACKLRPRWLLLENVPGMRNTAITDENGSVVNIIDYVRRRLGSEYAGAAEVVQCERYGVPQTRKRLITIFTRDESGKKWFTANGGSFFSQSMQTTVRTLRDAIGHLPALNGRPGENARTDFHPYHYVNPLDDRKYWWIEHTPEGDTAFSNQCVSPECGHDDNPRHKDGVVNGKSTAGVDTPIYCLECGSLLPRPTVIDKDGSLRLLKGFHSAYRRMKWDEPGRALTQNFIYEASDNKVHPDQNRVLSVLEALILQTIDRYDYKLSIGGKNIGTARIAEVIGESVPPLLIEKICQKMLNVSDA